MATSQCIDPFPSDIDRYAFGHWLSGFTDGEGCFGLWEARVQRWSRAGASFVIDLRADDHRALRLAQSFWQCGKLWFKVRDGVRLKCVYRVDARRDLLNVLVPHFDRYPLMAKKARDFAIWKRGVELINRVGERKRKGQKGLRGTLPRWQADEWREFRELVAIMRKSREFETGGEWLPMPAPAD